MRLRFLLAIVLWVLLGIGGIWLSATALFMRHVEAGFHDELEVHVQELARLTRIGDGGKPELLRPLSDPRYEVPLSGYYWQVTADQQPPLRSASMTRGELDERVARSLAITQQESFGPTGPAIAYGVRKTGPEGEDVHLVIATDQRELDKVLAGFTRELSLWLAALGALLLATGVAIINFGLRPLDRLGQAIAELRAGRNTQLESGFPSEIAPLVDDLNAYVRQSGEMLARARVQAGNLAHSLRTPLAVVIDEAERLAQGANGTHAAKVLLDQAQMMEQQIEYQLARARSAAGIRLPGNGARLPDMLEPILSAMRRLHPDKQFVMDSRLAAPVLLPLDPIDLSELLAILLDNAGKWAAGTVRIELAEHDGALRVAIADDGPGMTSEQIGQAFEIGRRFDPGKAGSGLGLAIARDLAVGLGAKLELHSEGSGLTAELRMPLPQDSAQTAD